MTCRMQLLAQCEESTGKSAAINSPSVVFGSDMYIESHSKSVCRLFDLVLVIPSINGAQSVSEEDTPLECCALSP